MSRFYSCCKHWKKVSWKMDYGFNLTRSSAMTQTIHIGQHIWSFLKLCNDVATEDIEDALLTANTRGAELVRKYVSTRIVEWNIPFFSPMTRQNSKETKETFSSLYKSVVNTTGNVKKLWKLTDVWCKDCLMHNSQLGHNVDMSSILKHELSCIPLSLANTDGTTKSNSKSALLGIL